MDCRTSSLPWIWAIEALACSNQVDLSLIRDLLKNAPEISEDNGRNARELVFLRVLERFFVQASHANPVLSELSQAIRLDPSDCCEDAVRGILSKTSPPHSKPAGPDMSKWDLEPFIEHKRSSLKFTLRKLKDAILTESHTSFASLKELSGLQIRNQADHEAPVKDGNDNAITPIVEGSNRDDGGFSPRDLPDENLEPFIRKRRANSESAVENSHSTDINSAKKYKHDIICTEHHVGGKLTSSGVDTQLVDSSAVSMQHVEGKRCSFGRETHVGSMRLNESPKEDGNECPDEALLCGKHVAHCDAELNNIPEEQQEHDRNTEEAKGDKIGYCDLERINDDMDKFEQNIQNVAEVEEHVEVSGDNDRNSGDRTDTARKEDASFGPQCTLNQYSSATTNCGDENLLAGTSRGYIEEERCSLQKKTRLEVVGQDGPPGDGNNQCTLSKVLVGDDEALPHEMQACHSGTEAPNNKIDEERQDIEGEDAELGRKVVNGLITTDKNLGKSVENVPRDLPSVDEAEVDVVISSDSDGYDDERTSIDTRKKTFLSSQCTKSQDSLATTDLRELPLCVKCNKGGKLSSCSSESCPLVIHESCLGSNASYDSTGKFYCPFCAYSRDISKYMEAKKKASLSRKDLATFICSGTRQESKKRSRRSLRIQENHLEQGDSLPKSNEPNKRDVVDNCKHSQRFEHQHAGPSELRPRYDPPFGGKSLDSIDSLTQTLDKEKQDGERKRQVSQSPRVHGQEVVAAMAIRNPEDEITHQVSVINGSKEHADIRSKKGATCPPETDSPREGKCSQGSQSADAEEISEEENESAGASKYFIRVRKQERQNLYPAIPQLRRKRVPWTSAEEDSIKEGMRLFYSPHDKKIPWSKILEYGIGVFQPSRSTLDLKDKWRNMCKAMEKSK